MMNTYLRTVICCAFLALVLPATAQKMEGMASFYADKFDGLSTSTGETFRQNGYMAASHDFNWGTILEVTNLKNGRKVQVRVNDCGPHAKGRIIDLSRRAAQDLDFIKDGEVKVRLRVIRASDAGPNCARGAWAKKLKAAGKPIPPKPGPWNPAETAHLTVQNGAAVVTTANTGPATVVPPTVPAPALGGRPVEEVVVVTPTAPTNVRGFASYVPDRLEGQRTSTGEVYSSDAFTATSKAYPYNTTLEVTNVTSGQQVVVRVNDCGPNDPNRLLDLSRAAADQIGLRRAGTAAVSVRIIQLGTDGPTCDRAAWVRNIRENQAAGRAVQEAGTVVAPTGATPDLPARSTVTPAEVAAGPATYGNATTLSPPSGAGTEKAYTVQLGAFRNEASAYAIYDELVEKGYVDALVYQNLDNNLYTTVLQTVYDKSAANRVKAQAIKDGFKSAGLKEVQEFPASIMAAPQSKARTETPITTGAPAPATYGGTVVEPETAPVATPAPAKEPTFEPDAILFGVQVGAFSTADGVKKVKEELDAAGVDLVYDAKVGKMTRVFAGKFYFQSQARELQTKLREMGYEGATVRRVQ